MATLETIDVRDSLAYVIHRYARLQRRHFVFLLAQVGIDLTQEQWFLLNHLYRNGAQNPSEMADEVFTDRPNVTRMLQVMERKKLVRRRDDPEDGRRVLFELTALGRGQHEKVEEFVHRERAELFDHLAKKDVQAARRVINQLEQTILRRLSPSDQL